MSTADKLGFLMDQSDSKITLSTPMTKPQTLGDVRLEMLGDRQGSNIGMIETLQTFQFSVGLNFPLEPFCYFVL